MKLSQKVCDEFLPGKSITKISHLGSGRMGSVYKVTFDKEESLCVKILPKNHYTKSQDSDGWKCAYNHFNFNFQSHEDNKYFYFTTPYFEGQLFHYAIHYDLKTRFEIIKNLIKATKDIHQKGLIHRDLKCNNIIIDKENRVYIIDFGRSVSVFKFPNSKASAYIPDLQLPNQSIITSNIKRIFQPYTAPEYFQKHYHNGSNIGFRSDYYSIAQLCRFLIPEYYYLADEVLYTDGLDRNTAFGNFCKKIDETFRDNVFNPKFYESDNSYFKEFRTVFRKIIFFIRQILDRLFKLAFRFVASQTIKQIQPAIRYHACHDISSNFFKLDKPNLSGTNLTSSLPNYAVR